MKKVILLSLICVIVQLFSVTVDGYALLEGGTDHSGIEVFFQRVAPDTNYNYTVYTDSSGYFSQIIENGWYDITYSKSGFISADTTDVVLYSDQTLLSKTLEVQGLSGLISGILTEGEYTVEGDLIVQNGDSLIIEPGVILNFPAGSYLRIGGYLSAIGTADNYIFFNALSDNWNGITLNTYCSVSMKFCSINKTSGRAIGINCSNDDTDPDINLLNIEIFTLNNGIEVYSGAYANNHIFNSIKITGNNLAGSKGVFAEANMLKLDNCEISGFDIGMDFNYCGAELYNSTIQSKSYGIIINDWRLNVYNSVIVDTDGSAGYGIYDKMANGTEIFSVNNSNIYGWNQNYYNCGDYIGVNVTTNANADSCDAYGNIKLDPMFVDAVNGNYRLRSVSPCIDAGTNTISGYTFPEFDLGGNARIVDSNNDSSVIVDMGAYEYYQIITTPDSPTNITTSIVSNTLIIDWDFVSGASSYLIFHSDDPYGTFELIKSTCTNTWSTTIDVNTKKFYKIVASTDGVK